MRQTFKYFNNCVNWNSSELESLENLIDDEIEIEYAELTENVSQEELDSVFTMYEGCPLTLEKDWHVRYFKTKLNGELCYMVRHSAIEYVFCN
jgi:hypothetical protein